MADFVVKMRVDASDAQRASAAGVAGLGRMQAAARQAASAIELDFRGVADAQIGWINKVLTADEVANQAMLRRVHAANEARIQAAVSAGEAEVNNLGLADRAAQSFGSSLQNIALQAISLQAAIGFVRSVADAMEEAHRSATDMAKQLGEVEKDLREIANLRNKVAPDDEEVKKYVELREQTGLTHAQAVSFTTEIESGAAGISEAKLSRAERERLTVAGGQFATRVSKDDAGISNRARILGILGGYLPGQVTANQIVGTADVAETILQAGSGSNTQLATQYQKVLTGITSQGLAGFSRNPLEAASLTAIASKFGPEEAATSTIEALREMRGFTRFRKTPGLDASQAGTLERAKITEFDRPIQAMEKLFKLIDVETKGGKAEAVDAYLARQGFRNLTGNQRIAQFYEQYQQGEFQRITGLAGTPIDVNAPGRKFGQFAATDTGRDLLSAARTDAARLGVGQFFRPVQLAAQEAEAKAIAGGLDTDFRQVLDRPFRGGRQGILEQQALEAQRQRLGIPQGIVGLPSEVDPTMRGIRNIPFIGPRAAATFGAMTGMNAVDAQYMAKLEALQKALDANTAATKDNTKPAGNPAPQPVQPKPPLNPAPGPRAVIHR